jgi:hypothetical protein
MIYTFYSFKGGVGRSMALAGVAYLLAERGLRVLAIDFDLEAPGLERYYFEDDEARRVRERPGLMDLILQYKRALTSESEFARASFRDWQQFVTDAVPVTAPGGSVDLMTAGCRAPDEQLRLYARAVRGFDWQDFLDNWSGALFFEWLRQIFLASPKSYDVVLIDSRTGVTEMGGVCTYQLADVAVLLCAANYQNLDGTLSVVRDFRSDAVLALRGGRPLELLVIPARLEPEHPQREQFFADFERAFATEGLPKLLADAGLGYRSLALPYGAAHAIGDRLVGAPGGAVDPAGPAGLAAVFGRLADALTLLAGPGRLGAQRDGALARLRGQRPAHEALSVADVTQRGAGFDAFLDAALPDAAAAAALRDYLSAAGLTITQMSDIGAGREWSGAIERALAYSQALVVVFGATVSSPHRAPLIATARKLGKPIVPVLVGPAATPEMLASYGLDHHQALRIDTARDPGADPGAGMLLDALRARAPAAGAAAASAQPYPGMRAFDEDDEPWFHARDGDAERLLEKVLAHGIVVLQGPSGVGKSSLIRAGLIPRLRRLGRAGAMWQIETIDFGSQDIDDATAPEPIAASGAGSRLLVLDGVDTFVATGTVESRRRRVERVAAIVAREAAHAKIVICGRNVARDAESEVLAGAPPTHPVAFEEVRAMSVAELRDVIVRPSQRERHLFEGGLVDRLLADAGSSPGALALLQMVLPQLWSERRRGWITNKAYGAADGVGGRLRSQGMAWLERCQPADRARTLVFFRSLMRLDSALALVPERRLWSELETIEALAPDAVGLRDRLAAERLIVVESGPDPACALAHADAATYLQAGQFAPEFMLWRQRFATHVLAWVQQRLSVQGAQLIEAERWLSTSRSELTSHEVGVIEASRLAAAEALEHQEQQRALARAQALARDEESRLRERRAAADGAVAGDLLQRANQALVALRRPFGASELADARRLVLECRNAREYEAMGLLAEAVSRQSPDDAATRRLYAQYFIETGRTTAAIDVLTSMLQWLPAGHPEQAEAWGLLGRAYKQVFLESVDRAGPGARAALDGAVAAYRKPFEADGRSNVWHGVNLLGLVSLARRTEIDVAPGLQQEAIARRIVTLLGSTPREQRDVWYWGTLAEAHLGLRDWNAVERCLQAYLADPGVQAFAVASTLRQFTQVWDLEHDSDMRGRRLVDILRARLAQLPGAVIEHDAAEIERLRVAVAPETTQLEAVLGAEGSRTYAWWRHGLACARSVASVRNRAGDRVGTGFLVRSSDLGLVTDEVLLLTAFHVVNEHGFGGAVPVGDATFAFEAADASLVFPAHEVVWSSPTDQHDAFLLRLAATTVGIDPLSIAPMLPRLDVEARVVLIGHAGGRELAVSFQDNTVLDHEGPPLGKPMTPGVCRVHYGAAAEAGSSGSPVFDSDSWTVIAMHHMGGHSLPRLNGKPGTYEANEGIGVAAIAAAIGAAFGGA